MAAISDDPYTSGQDAYSEGQEIDSNPHPKGTELHEAWAAGWYDARAEEDED